MSGLVRFPFKRPRERPTFKSKSSWNGLSLLFAMKPQMDQCYADSKNALSIDFSPVTLLQRGRQHVDVAGWHEFRLWAKFHKSALDKCG